MNRTKYYSLILFFWSAFLLVHAQEKPIFLENPSFESIPTAAVVPIDWEDCQADSEYTPPDTQPGAFGVDLPAIDGDTYLGLVVRDNVTWEGVAQELEESMRTNRCYLFQLALAQSDYYLSHSIREKEVAQYVEPAILRIWGGDAMCAQQELLAETLPVDHLDWDSYTFYLCPSEEWTHLSFEVYYKEGTETAYNGNLLVDDASPLYPLPYADGEILWESVPKSNYLSLGDVEQLEILLPELAQQIEFDGDVLPYSMYLDARNGLRYGNRYFETIIQSMQNIENYVLYIAVEDNATAQERQRIKELKAIVREAKIPLSLFKIKKLEKFKDESDWLVETPFLKLKLVKR